MGTISEKSRLAGLYSHSVSHFTCRQCLFFKRMEGRGSKCLQIKARDGIGIAPSARCEDRTRVERKHGHMLVLTLSVVSNFLLPLGSALAESSTENATQHSKQRVQPRPLFPATASSKAMFFSRCPSPVARFLLVTPRASPCPCWSGRESLRDAVT